MVLFDGRRDVLHQHRFTCPGRGDDQGALALADRGHDVDDAAGTILLGRIPALHFQAAVRIERRQVVEVDFLVGLVRVFEIDPADIGQGEVALGILRGDDRPFDRVAGADVRFLEDFGADIDVVRTRQVVRFRRAQEAEAVDQNLEHALARDLDFAVRQLLQDRKQHILGTH